MINLEKWIKLLDDNKFLGIYKYKFDFTCSDNNNKKYKITGLYPIEFINYEINKQTFPHPDVLYKFSYYGLIEK